MGNLNYKIWDPQTMTPYTQMVPNPAYGTDVSIVHEVQTQANLAYHKQSHARMA